MLVVVREDVPVRIFLGGLRFSLANLEVYGHHLPGLIPGFDAYTKRELVRAHGLSSITIGVVDSLWSFGDLFDVVMGGRYATAA